MTFLTVFICGLLSMPFLFLGVLFLGLSLLIEEIIEFAKRVAIFLGILLVCAIIVGIIWVIVQAVRDNNGDLLQTANQLVALILLMLFVFGIIGGIVCAVLGIGLNILAVAVGAVIAVVELAAGITEGLGNFCIGISTSLLGTILRRTQKTQTQAET